MTIHQAKGLEFPVVVVGSLSTQLSSPKQIDHDLGPFYHRPPFEPENRITLFDRMRLRYVAFSRPQKVLVLTAHETPKALFVPIWQGLPQWPYAQQDLLAAQRFALRERMPVKESYSFTGDLKIYETCPRQYQFFRDYAFTPSRSAVIFFGLLVHQTIEEIHRIALDGKLELLDFKTSPRPTNSPSLLAAYERQLCTYAHILERRYGKRVDRLLLYWTAEEQKDRAVMAFPYCPEHIDEAGRYFDQAVARIQAEEFRVTHPPEATICKECDLRSLCRSDGTITMKD
jgi:hypothetical protein